MTRRPAERVPPQDLEAERGLLGAMLLSPGPAIAAALDAGVTPDSFYKPSHGHIADAIFALADAGEGVDQITVAARLAAVGLGGEASVGDLTSMVAEVPSTGHAATYARVIVELARARRLIAVGLEVAELGYSAPADVDAAVERSMAMLEDLAAPACDGEKPWPALADEGWHGPFGEYALLASAYTEADPVGILACLLAAFGAVVGPSPHMNAGNVRHPVNIGVVLVGQSAKARKGSAFAAADQVLRAAEPAFRKARVLGGFNSGEAMADAFRGVDGGPVEPRLLVLEPEFCRFLAAASRDGSSMSQMARHAWDGWPLETRARSLKVVVDQHHLAVVAQTTAEELRARLRADDVYNGFANRFLWVGVRRGELQPNGGNVPAEAITYASNAMTKAIHKARRKSLMNRNAAGETRWDQVYREIAADDPGGPIGGATNRGDAQTLRLAMLYALADGAASISEVHVDAAFALWRYCRASAAWIWGDGAAVGPLETKLIEALRRAAPGGLNRSDVHGVLHNHASGAEIDALVRQLEQRGLVKTVKEETGGWPRVVTRLASNE